MRLTIQEQKIKDIIDPAIADMGYDIIRVQIQSLQKARPILQIMAERQSDGQISVEDCAKISRTVSALMDVEDVIDEAYELEVSSAGIDRPLTRPKDYIRFVGFEVKIDAPNVVAGRKRFSGILKNANDNEFTLACEDIAIGDITFTYDQIEKAKLVLNNHLLEALRPKNMPTDIIDEDTNPTDE